MNLNNFLHFIHIVVCLSLIGIVMIQASEGEGLSGAFGGGGSYALFGKRGATGFVARATTFAAVAFMVTSFSLTYSVRSGGNNRPTTQVGAPLAPSAPNTGAPLAQ